MIKAKVHVKFTTLVGTTKTSAVIPYEVEVDGADNNDLTPQQLAITHTLLYFLKHYVVSEGDSIEVKSVELL